MLPRSNLETYDILFVQIYINLQIRRHFAKQQVICAAIWNSDNMIYRAYISDLQEIQDLDGCQNWQIDYHISEENAIKCNHVVCLYGLCFYLHQKIEPKHYSTIQASYLQIAQEDMQQAVYFLNRFACKYLYWAEEDYEAQSILHFMRTVLRNYDVKMIIKFEQDIVETSVTNKSQAIYVIIYYFSEITQNKIIQFGFQKFHIKNEEVQNKIQMLGINKSGQIQDNVYGINTQVQKVCTKIITINLLNTNNSSSEINSSKSKNQSKVNNKFLIIFGCGQNTKSFLNKLQKQINAIKIKVFRKGNEMYNNYLFAVIKMMTEKYNKSKTVTNDKDKTINVYFHESVQDIFNAQIMEYQKYKIAKISAVKSALKDSSFGNIKDKIPNLMIYQDKTEGQMIIANRQIIQCLESITQRKNMIKNKQKEEVVVKFNKNAENDRKQDYNLEFLNNIEVREDNLNEFMNVCGMIKLQQYMTFKIDVGNYIRITNRVKRSKVVYLVFEYYYQILQLQSVIQDTISMKQLQRVIKQYQNDCFHKSKKIKSKNGQLVIKLYPSTEEMWINKDKYFQSLVNELKQDKDELFRCIVCTINLFCQILAAVNIDFLVTFVLNQQIPMIECDELLDKHTYESRLLVGKTQLDFYSQIKVDVINKQFRNAQTCKKDENTLKQIMSNNIHEYEVGDYILSEIDEYNISFMIAEGLNNMYLILSKKPLAEYVYLTYHNKLVKIIRDKFGNFSTLQQASMSKDLTRNSQVMIRPALLRAFLTGQKYVAINMPFEHVKLMSLSNINRLPIGNYGLVKYYLRKMNQSERFKIEIKSPFTLQYFQHKFAKNYKIKFQNKELKKQIKELDFGYGNIKKERLKPFVCLTANYQICGKILKKFELDYQNKGKQHKK